LIRKKTTLLLALLIAYFCGFALVSSALATAVVSSVQSSDPYGASKDFYQQTEDVWANGSGFPVGIQVDIYVVNHTTWTDGMKIPSDGIKTTVQTDGSGAIAPTIVWDGTHTPGPYDIVVDVGRDGYYNASTDALDNHLQVGAGFFVVPELILGTVGGLVALFAAFGVYRYSKRRK
jgi:hypothetical protein